MPTPRLPITAHIAGRAYTRDDVLAWEAKRAAKVSRRLRLGAGSSDLDALNRRIVARKLELGNEALERMLRYETRLSEASSRLSAAASRGRRTLATTVLTCPTGRAEQVPQWYAERFPAGGPPMLAASPDHWIFRHRTDGRDEVVETAAGSPTVVQMFFDDLDTSSVVSPPDPSYPTEWVAIARSGSGTPIGGIRHRFRDEGADGFTAELNVEFPRGLLPSMITQHCWHLASEFGNWLEFATGVRDPNP